MNYCEEARKIDIKNVAEDLGVQFNKFNQCLCVNHQEKTPSMKIYKNKLICFGCKSNLSTIDLYMLMKNLNCKEATRDLLNKYKNVKNLEKRKINDIEAKPPENKKNIDLSYLLTQSKKINNLNENEFIKAYLQKRCIPKSIEILKNNGIDIYFNVYRSSLSIIYYFKKNNFAIQKGYNKESKEKFKINRNSNTFSFLKVNENKIIWITEGIEDALSFAHFNRNSITLNSTSNTDKFLKTLDHWEKVKEYKFFIATDNDKAGEECSNEIEKYFQKHNIMYEIYDLHKKKGLKDINDLLKNNKKI